MWDKRLWCRRFTWLAVLAAALGVLPARGAEPAGAVDGAGLDRLVNALGSADFDVRAAAQKKLEQVPAAQRALLQARADAAGDPEVKARLQERIAAIDADGFLTPPTVTLDLRGVTVAEATEALSKATGYPLRAGASRVSPGTVTLQVKDVPFMEVVRQLLEKGDLRYGPSTSGAQLTPATGVVPAQSAGPVLFCPNLARHLGGTVSFNYNVYCDPRMEVLERTFTVTDARDDNGAKLGIVSSARTGFGGTGPVGPQDYQRINHTPWGFEVEAPADPKRTVTLKGEAYLRVVTKYAMLDVANPAGVLGQVLTVGGREVTVAGFTRAEGRPLLVRVTSAAPARGPVGGLAGFAAAPIDIGMTRGPATAAPIRCDAVDSEGTVLGSLNTDGTEARQVPVTAAKGAVHLRVVAPVEWKQVVVPFELKGLEVPAVTVPAGRRGAPAGRPGAP